MLILHGDNQSKVHAQLSQVLADCQQKEITTQRLEAKHLSLAELEEALQAQSLFGNEKTIILEGLFSLPNSKKRTALIDFVKNHQEAVVLVENKTLTASNLKNFPQAKVEHYPLTNTLFSFLDSLNPQGNKTQQLNKLQAAITQDGAFMCLVMLARQIRLLIQAKEGHKMAGAPFMLAKLKKQSQNFSLEQLLKLHQQLYRLDSLEKTSQNLLSLENSLELFIINS